MRRLLNSLYVVSDDAYLSLKNENVCVHYSDKPDVSIPLISLESIVCMSRRGASPYLMAECCKMGVDLVFLDTNGRFLARVGNETKGNVLLRRNQYRFADNEEQKTKVARNLIIGKLHNSRTVLSRARRDHSLMVDCNALLEKESFIFDCMKDIYEAENTDSIRGIEGKAAASYFSVFDNLILSNKKDFCFRERSRRPPLDPVNAMLSFVYSLLASNCASALEAAGLDPYVGFLHCDRSGRQSLGLDLMEELRPYLADRLVLTLINNKVVNPNDFEIRENGAVLLDETGRKKLLSSWQQKKTEEITHPYLQEKIPIGLLPNVQAILLAKYIRGDIDGYPAFLWR